MIGTPELATSSEVATGRSERTLPAAVLAAYRYVARNPVAAGLVDRPEEWRWSSYGAAVGVSDLFGFVDPGVVLGEFGSTRAAQVRGLRRFVDAG
jgi:putative transposase